MRRTSRFLLLSLGGLLASLPLASQTWEVAPVGVWQTQTSSTYWEKGSTSTWALRGSWLGSRDGGNRLKVEIGWTPLTTWSAQGLDGSRAHVRASSVLLGASRETWFLEDRFAFSVGLDLRTTRMETTQGTSAAVVNHLPQLWIRVGVGARLWSLGGAEAQDTGEPARYSLLRLELGEAAPRGPSATDELLPQREITLACGLRF